MVRVLAAPDKFRGTATAAEVSAAIASAVLAAGGTCRSLPMADGGEGMLDVFGGPNRSTTVTGPLGSPVSAGWRLNPDGLAVIESAQACGLAAAGGARGNDPVQATTRGVGELLVEAIHAGASQILVGVGGSATTDGGRGAVEALLDARAPLHSVGIEVCCDVDTRFTDAASVFGPQKGATPADVATLTTRLQAQRAAYRAEFGVDVEAIPGSGAAGGLAGGLAAVGARLVSGFDRIADQLGLAEAMAGADLVVTGEGRLDATSLTGKVVGGVWRQARAIGRPVVAVVGTADPGAGAAGLSVLSLTALFGARRAFGDTTGAITDAVASYLARSGTR